ncbi:hypothetical protein CEXT_580811 [Caerostris extrusa]|uniref:Uncharacterized protein n=1 Tax=Caerostris extrusa TaxID=172846 RepID=A0AAV4V1E0_CAEEX|nr:hypothetical protein CEXT_580811 [Caerostris extrusa]
MIIPPILWGRTASFWFYRGHSGSQREKHPVGISNACIASPPLNRGFPTKRITRLNYVFVQTDPKQNASYVILHQRKAKDRIPPSIPEFPLPIQDRGGWKRQNLRTSLQIPCPECIIRESIVCDDNPTHSLVPDHLILVLSRAFWF